MCSSINNYFKAHFPCAIAAEVEQQVMKDVEPLFSDAGLLSTSEHQEAGLAVVDALLHSTAQPPSIPVAKWRQLAPSAATQVRMQPPACRLALARTQPPMAAVVGRLIRKYAGGVFQLQQRVLMTTVVFYHCTLV